MQIIIPIKILPGTYIEDAGKEVILACKRLECNMEFMFNGVSIFVMQNSNLDDILRQYHQGLAIQKEE